ncbi:MULTISPECIES: hypothetical protein [Thalassospira]|uniref:Uncharacterized protein n=2 Tax=Thalassospira TaxID=168934 RepID=A0A367W5A4_9PROT|nr:MULTISPECIES: hypothetical protein [Thalassospira]MDG4720967.1 hypothetical protein [Thalassospira sp. FZY0004]RCK36625.1 hypothetical protein TH19_11890 [Thalassospira profundimaris]
MSDLENDLGEDIDFEEFEAHTEKLLDEGRTKDDLFEFVGFMNINEVGTHMIAAEMVLDEDAIDQMSKNLRKLEIDLGPLGELTGGLKGGEDVKRALGALFLELVELCELDEDDEDAGELSEESLLLLNFIKRFNPQMRRLTVALTDTDDDDVSCEYEVTNW